jgi:hypothetical protein
MTRFKRWYILIPLITVFAFSIYYVFTTSTLVRFWADDFCSSTGLRDNGYLNSQILWWKSWTGRYSYIAFLDLVELFGLNGAKILPVILFLAFSIPAFITIGVPALVLIPIFLVNSPNIIQTFYWMTGSLNYFAPFVLLNVFVLLLFKPLKKYNNLLGFVILFIATGFSEAFGVANLLFLAFLYLVLDNKNKRKFILYGLVSTFLSLAFMSAAPGNAVRSSTVSHPSSLFELIRSTVTYTKWYLIHLFYIKTFVVSLLTVIFGSFVFLDSKTKYFKKPKFVIISSLVFCVLVTLTVVGLTYQAMNWEPPERVMSIANNIIIMASVFLSIAFFQIFNKYLSSIFIKILFILLCIALTYQIHIDWNKVKNELYLSANSSTYMTVGKLDGLEDNKGWVKSCIDGYYRRSVVNN